MAASSPQIVDYNLVAPTPVPLIATFDYEGPPLEFCSNPQMKVTDANGDEYTFPDADGVE